LRGLDEDEISRRLHLADAALENSLGDGPSEFRRRFIGREIALATVGSLRFHNPQRLEILASSGLIAGEPHLVEATAEV
jgi:hypothetical protein